MAQNEDVWTVEEVVIEPIIEEQAPVEEEVVIETPQNDEITITESEIDTMLTDILNEIPTEPIFPETKKDDGEEKIETNNEDFLTEEELEALDTEITELENSLSESKKAIEEKDTTILELNSTIEEINSTISTKDAEISVLEEWLGKISDHPIIWPLAKKIILWEELDIPEYLTKAINDDLNAIPDFGNIQNTGLPQTKTKSVHDKLKDFAKQSY